MTDERAKEQAYLQLVYQELLAAKKSYQSQLADSIQKGKTLLDEFDHDTSLNFDSHTENLETLAMLEMKNREIDQWNLKNQNNAAQLAKVEHLLGVPYFGKIVLSFDDSPTTQETFYIGVNDFTSLAAQTRVHDWRSPIAGLFYNNVLGAILYQANDTTVSVQLELKRQFLIEKSRLLNYFDTTIAI